MKDVPAAVATSPGAREKLIEAVAETDDELLNKYLEEGTSARRSWPAPSVPASWRARSCRSSVLRHQDHRPRALDLIVESFPSPLDRGEVEGTDLRRSRPPGGPDPKAPVTALVFKTLSDPTSAALAVSASARNLTADSQL